jgi:hypothetical protein
MAQSIDNTPDPFQARLAFIRPIGADTVQRNERAPSRGVFIWSIPWPCTLGRTHAFDGWTGPYTPGLAWSMDSNAQCCKDFLCFRNPAPRRNPVVRPSLANPNRRRRRALFFTARKMSVPPGRRAKRLRSVRSRGVGSAAVQYRCRGA